MAMKKGELDSITITRPDDWHLHIREGVQMARVLVYTARQFDRAIIMPNLKPPVATVKQVREYHNDIRIVLNGLGLKNFQPLMTLYLTDSTTPADIREAKASGLVYGVKLYPANATTNSAAGVTDLKLTYPALEEMEKVGMRLLVHGEVTDPTVDVFDRERIFIEKVLEPLLVRRFQGLRIVLEHATTGEAVAFVEAAENNIAATITAHHLLENRNALFRDGIRPHNYCLPIFKREEHRKALLGAATSGSPKFFLGTDSAPHSKSLKENACGCAGCFTAFHALQLYAEAFDSVGALNKLEGFASFHGADFYGLPRNTSTVTLIREKWEVPTMLSFGDDVIVPFRAGEKCKWKMK